MNVVLCNVFGATADAKLMKEVDCPTDTGKKVF
jgi:hypothetical protein